MSSLVVVTGAGGLIGGYVAKHLADQGHRVVALVRSIDPVYMENAPELEWIEWDVLSDSIPEALRGISPDLVYHAATANDIMSRDREAGYKLSLLGTNRVFEWARTVGTRRFLFLSTFQVYGQELTGEISEKTRLELSNDYGLNHRFGELFLALRGKEGGMGITALRPSNVYGVPWCSRVNRWTLVPMCFCQNAIDGERIEIRSSGRQMRNFVHLSRLAIAAEAALEQSFDGFRLLNVASPHYYSIREVAQLVRQEYENFFERDLRVDIHGGDPLVPNEFNVSGEAWDHFTQGKSKFDEQQNRLSDVILELLKLLHHSNRVL